MTPLRASVNAQLELFEQLKPQAVTFAPGTKMWYAPPHSGPDTSRAAAAHVAPSCKEAEAALLEFVRSRGAEGATDAEMCEHFGWDGNYQRPRRWRWSKEGILVQSDVKRKTPSGCMARAWIVAEVRA